MVSYNVVTENDKTDYLISEIKNGKCEKIAMNPLKGSLELKNVTFGYEPNKPILKNVSY